jgi:hypothetical protein
MILSSACRQWRADTHPTIWDEPWSSKLHHVLGHDQFLAQHVEIKDGVMYAKATGKYSSISQNGTVFTYSVW